MKKVYIAPKFVIDLIDPAITVPTVVDEATPAYIKDALMYKALVFEIYNEKYYMLNERNYDLTSEEIETQCRAFTKEEAESIIEGDFKIREVVNPIASPETTFKGVTSAAAASPDFSSAPEEPVVSSYSTNNTQTSAATTVEAEEKKSEFDDFEEEDEE